MQISPKSRYRTFFRVAFLIGPKTVSGFLQKVFLTWKYPFFVRALDGYAPNPPKRRTNPAQRTNPQTGPNEFGQNGKEKIDKGVA